MLVQLIIKQTKTASFEGGPDQEKELQQVQAALSDTLSVGSLDPAEPMILEVALADIHVLCSLWQATGSITVKNVN